MTARREREPMFSVVVPFRDARPTLERACRSLLHQTFRDFEVILVDDGSRDSGADVVRGLDDPRFRLIASPGVGPAEARNRGIREARGRFVTFLDADDEALPRWLERFARLAEGSAWVLRCGAILLRPDGIVRDVVFPQGPRKLRGWLSGFLPGTYAVERQRLVGSGGFDGSLRFGEHADLAFRLYGIAAEAEVALARDLLIRKYWSGGNARYGRARTEAALTLLERHRQLLRRAPTVRADYLTVAAVGSAREGRRTRAVALLLRAWAADPLSLKRVARLVATSVPFPGLNALAGRGVPRRPTSADGGPPPSVSPPARSREPRVSVIIPVRDSAATLGRQLRALSRQGYTGDWEVIVADNGSRDGLRAVVGQHGPLLPRLRVVDAGPDPGVSRARNAGARAANGDLILVCDADDEVTPGWIQAMVEASRQHDLVGGPLEPQGLNDSTLLGTRYLSSEGAWQDDPLPWVPGANCGIWREVWRLVGGWDESSKTEDDLDLSWRVQLAGFTIGSAPGAKVRYAFRQGPVANLRQAFSYSRGKARAYRRYRAVGMPRRPVSAALKSWAWAVIHSLDAVGPDPARTFWFRHVGRQLGRALGSIEQRVVYP